MRLLKSIAAICTVGKLIGATKLPPLDPDEDEPEECEALADPGEELFAAEVVRTATVVATVCTTAATTATALLTTVATLLATVFTALATVFTTVFTKFFSENMPE